MHEGISVPLREEAEKRGKLIKAASDGMRPRMKPAS